MIADLDGQVSSQETGKGAKLSGTATRAAARDALREDIEGIVRTARVMSETKPRLDAALINRAADVEAIDTLWKQSPTVSKSGLFGFRNLDR